jgi:small subunit ribosomal protein S11
MPEEEKPDSQPENTAPEESPEAAEPGASEPEAPEPEAPEPEAPEPEAAASAPEAVSSEADSEAADGRRKGRGKAVRHIPSGIAHVEATFNNTKVSISDNRGNIVSWCSGGRLGYRGSRKSTSYVAQLIGTEAAKRAMAFGMREVEVRVKGPGSGRESAVRGIAAAGLTVTVLRDVTPIPHNGCRPPKRRRV